MKVNIYLENTYLTDYIQAISPKLIVHTYNELSELLTKRLKTNNNIFMIDLDFSYSDNNVILRAGKLKQLYPQSQIIFIVDRDNYVSEIYDIDHCYCLIRDSINDHLTSALLKAVKALASQVVIAKTKQEMVQVPIENIKYIERKGLERKTYIHTKNNRHYLSTDQFKDIIPYLPDNYFVLCHNSFMVPIKDIITVEQDQLTLIDDTIVPVSRSHHGDVLTAIEQRR